MQTHGVPGEEDRKPIGDTVIDEGGAVAGKEGTSHLTILPSHFTNRSATKASRHAHGDATPPWSATRARNQRLAWHLQHQQESHDWIFLQVCGLWALIFVHFLLN